MASLGLPLAPLWSAWVSALLTAPAPSLGRSLGLAEGLAEGLDGGLDGKASAGYTPLPSLTSTESWDGLRALAFSDLSSCASPRSADDDGRSPMAVA